MYVNGNHLRRIFNFMQGLFLAPAFFLLLRRGARSMIALIQSDSK